MPQVTPATLRDWIGLALLTVVSLLIAADLSVLLFAIPEISYAMHPGNTELLWIIDIYGFTLAGLLITMGTLGDRIGRRRLLMIGAGVFALASLAAAFAPNAPALIALRAMLGIGGATMAPSTLGLIRNMFHDDRQRQKAIAIWTGGFAGGAGLGPILGGLLLQNFWWGSVFLINVPVMLVLLVAAPVVLPESRDAKAGPVDLTSVALSLLGVLPLIYGMKELLANGFEAVPVGSIALGLAATALFVLRQTRLERPLIDLKLFAIPSFTAAMVSNGICQFAVLGMALFNVQYLLGVLDFEPFPAALWSLAPALAVGLGITAATVLSARVPKQALVASGLVVAAAGLLIVGQLPLQTSFYAFLCAMGLVTFGIGMVSALSTDLVMAAAPKERASSASALAETTQELAGALGIAVLGSIGSAIYRSTLPVVPAAARATFGAAIGVAEKLGAWEGAHVLIAAQRAFLSSMSSVATLAALFLLIVAALGLVMVRTRRAGAGPAVDVAQKRMI